MTTKSIKISAFALALAMLTSCSPRMVGTWTVQRFETTQPGQQGVSLNNIGTVEFKKGGTGEKNIGYSALGVTHTDNNPFKWIWNDGKYMTIEGEGSEFAKTWIVISNKKKFQKWKTTDGTNNVQIIELKKK